MNTDAPANLSQKIEYLCQKMDVIFKQIKSTDNFELKMKFIEFIDTSIQKIYKLDNRKERPNEIIRKKYEQYYNAEENQKEKDRINTEKEMLAYKLKDLNQKQKNLQIESLKIQLSNCTILKEKLLRQYNNKELQLKNYIHELQKKIKAQEKEIERLIKMNSAQAKQIQLIKEERNRAERKENQWREKYENQLGSLQTFNSKGSKYTYKSEEGLKNIRTFTNMTNEKKGCERFVMCDLPLRFFVAKIIYGIKLGVLMPNRQIEYFTEVSLYEREQMTLNIVQGIMEVEYVKRKVKIRLDKYKWNKPQVVFMLYGKGDSISIDETV